MKTIGISASYMGKPQSTCPYGPRLSIFSWNPTDIPKLYILLPPPGIEFQLGCTTNVFRLYEEGIGGFAPGVKRKFFNFEIFD